MTGALRMTVGVILRSVSDEGSELSKVEVVVQDLAGVVEHRTRGCLGYNLSENRFFASLRMTRRLRMTKGLELGADDEFVKVVDITLKMLSMMELQCSGADYRLQRVNRIWQINK